MALTLISPLPDGIVAGLKQVARCGDLIVSAELAATIREDTWAGIRIRIVSPSVGEVAANWFGFAEHSVFDNQHQPPTANDGMLNRNNAAALLTADRIDAHQLRTAVAAYTGVFTPATARDTDTPSRPHAAQARSERRPPVPALPASPRGRR